MQGAFHSFVRQLGIQKQAGHLDVVIDSVRQVHSNLTPHGARVEVQSFAFRIYFASYYGAGIFLEQRCEIYFLYIHVHAVGFVVDVVISSQLRFTAAEIRIAHNIHPHGLEVHLGGGQIRLSADFFRTCMQSVAGNQLAVQVNACIAVQSVNRQRQTANHEFRIADIYTAGIIETTAYIGQDVRLQRAREDIQTRRCEQEPHIS